MIKPEELRLDNWVYNTDSNGNEQVSTWHFEADAFSLIEPIPLTPEWLERFGFDPSFIDGIYELDNISVCIPMDEPHSISIGTDSIFELDHIQYVHQLQNLYFALTGKELELKQ